MAKKRVWLVMLVLALAFGMTAIGCEPEEEPETTKTPEPGSNWNNPINRIETSDLGTMTSQDSGWRQLLNSIDSTGKYVNLDLSACPMTGTSFNPDTAVETGKRYIVSIILPNAATSIEPGTDSDPTFKKFDINLKSVKGANITTIGAYSFKSIFNTTLKSVEFPKVTAIGAGAFSGCSGLESINFPLVTTIGESAFRSCGLKNVNFPLVTIIESNAFTLCSLENADFPLVTTIKRDAFSYCSGLSSLNIPKVTNIEQYAFSINSNTTLSITMGDTAPTLGYQMFLNTQTDKTVKIKVPSGATGYTPFTGTSVTVSGTNTDVNWANGFRGGGWNGTAFSSGGASLINQKISLTIEQQ